MSERILSEAGFLDHIVPMVVSHHERLDGQGYPAGLTGDAIPLGGRIISLADAFDAMTTDRAYRKALSREQALEELRRCAGTQFDAELVALFCRCLPGELHMLPGHSLSKLIASAARRGFSSRAPQGYAFYADED